MREKQKAKSADVRVKYDRRNYRKHDDRNKKLIRKSLEELGAGRSVVIDAENELIAGNGVFEQAEALGIKTKVIETDGSELVVVKRTDLHTDDEKRRKLALADNATSDSSAWDIEALKEDWQPEELEEWGVESIFDDVEQEPIAGETEPDSVPEIAEDEKPVSVLGKVYQLGDHRLMCGDSTTADDVAKLMNGEKADIALTDPPYGISIVQNSTVGGGGVLHFGTVGGKNIVAASKYRPVANDDTTETAKENFKILQEVSENQIIFGGNYFTDFLSPKACWIVWDKENTGNFADVELAWTSFGKGAKLYRWMWNGLARKGDRKTEGKSRVHPTQKPVGLLCEILKDFECETVVDCFGGSGSTLLACSQMQKRCFMLELEEHYCDVIRKRWAEFVHGEGCDWKKLTPEAE